MTKRASPSKKRHIVAEFHRRLERDQKSKTYIYQDLAGEAGVSSKTIQRWVSGDDMETKSMTAQQVERLEHLEEQDRILASGDYYIDEETGEIKQPEPIPVFSQDGRLLA